MRTIISNIIKKNKIMWFKSVDVKILGRWKIDYCDKKINAKLDMSNEDHCGTCNEYLINKLKQNKNDTIN